MRNENGITITALVIMIITLLILAGVSINLLLNNNGLINKAEEASKKYTETTNEENNQFKIMDDSINKTQTLLYQFINGNIQVGDYINYETPEQGEFTTTASGYNSSNGFANQTFNVSNNGERIKWRVLGMGDKDGNLTDNTNEATHLMIISDNPVQKTIKANSNNRYEKDPYLYMGKAEGYLNTSKILRGISNIYVNPKFAENARSINVNDINSALNVTVDYNKHKVYQTTNNNETNIDIVKHMGTVHNFLNNEYSPESKIKNKTALENGETSTIATAYSYRLEDTEHNKKYEDLLFKQTEIKGYWLDTTTIEVKRGAKYNIGKIEDNMVNLWDYRYLSNGSWSIAGMGVRPIISLKPDITINELNTAEEESEEWNYNNNLCYYGDNTNYDSTGTEIFTN